MVKIRPGAKGVSNCQRHGVDLLYFASHSDSGLRRGTQFCRAYCIEALSTFPFPRSSQLHLSHCSRPPSRLRGLTLRFITSPLPRLPSVLTTCSASLDARMSGACCNRSSPQDFFSDFPKYLFICSVFLGLNPSLLVLHAPTYVHESFDGNPFLILQSSSRIRLRSRISVVAFGVGRMAAQQLLEVAQ